MTLRALLDPLVFSSIWVAATAAALCLASGAAMGAWTRPGVVGLAFCGTLVIYNVDRLRDLSRDRETSPARSLFVERHRNALIGLSLVAASGSAWLAILAGSPAVLILTPVLLAGLFHRRLKRFGWWKPLYVSGAWSVVVVGLPAVTMPSPQHLGWVVAVLGTTVVANVVASNLRDDEAMTTRLGTRVPLAIARGTAATALVVGGLAPAPVRPLLGVPLMTLAALAAFRPDERYGLVVVDGALLLGALSALPWLAA